MNPKVFTALVALFGVGLIGGYVLHDMRAPAAPANPSGEESASKQVRQMGNYSYINPLLECEVAEGSIDARKENFHQELEDFVTTTKEKRHLTEVAVYFRDLNNGPAFGVDEGGEFFPASLLKVPVMMAYYHLAERNPSIMNTLIDFKQERYFGIDPTIIPREKLVVGQSYTVEELIRRMIVYSDNQAITLLSERLPLVVLQDLFKIIGVGEDVLVDSESKLTVKEYADFSVSSSTVPTSRGSPQRKRSPSSHRLSTMIRCRLECRTVLLSPTNSARQERPMSNASSMIVVLSTSLNTRISPVS